MRYIIPLVRHGNDAIDSEYQDISTKREMGREIREGYGYEVS